MAIKNLIVNALEATREKGEVAVSTQWADKIHIIVSDSGCGIPGEKLQAIFRPFFSMKNQGHGLGLAMVRRAVTLHSGEITVDSQPGSGSIFKIILPVFSL
jgi:two-component system sensor histidine kinase HydH